MNPKETEGILWEISNETTRSDIVAKVNSSSCEVSFFENRMGMTDENFHSLKSLDVSIKISKSIKISVAIAFPALSLIAMNTTDFFQKNFDFTSGDIKNFNSVALTAAIIGAAVLTGGAAGAAFGGGLAGAFAGAVVGAITGAVIGSVGFPALGLGDSHEGARYGAAVGGIAGAAAGYFGGAEELLNHTWHSYWDHQGALWDKSSNGRYFWDPFFDPESILADIASISGGPTLGGSLLYGSVTYILGDPKRNH